MITIGPDNVPLLSISLSYLDLFCLCIIGLCGSRQLQQVGLAIDQFGCDYHSREGWVIVTRSLTHWLPWEQVVGTNTNQSRLNGITSIYISFSCNFLQVETAMNCTKTVLLLNMFNSYCGNIGMGMKTRTIVWNLSFCEKNSELWISISFKETVIALHLYY